MLNEALWYASQGWRVFPCRPGEKEPIGSLVPNGCLNATTDETTIREWWAKQPDANIGIATGKDSDLTVVDLDGAEGIATGQQMNLQSSMVAMTGDGQQLFYRHHDLVRNSVKKLGIGLDTRGEGGYVVAPPSLHPNGKRYVWLNGPTKNLPELPQFIIDLIATNMRNGSRSPQTTGRTLSSQSIGWVSEALSSLAEGNRNDTFARVVGKLHHSGLDKTTIWALLLPYAKSSGFAESELNSVIQSITRYSTQVSESTVASSAESFLENAVPVSWLCDQIIAQGSIGFCAGLPESYKTWMLMDLSIECARGGGLWLGLFPVEACRVLFIDQERSKVETQRRFRGLLDAKALSTSDVKGQLFIRSGTTTRLDIDESYNALKKELTEIRPDLILVDSFAAFHTLEENNRSEIQVVLERVKEIRNEFGCAIIFIDHESKYAFDDAKNKIAPSAMRLTGSVGKIAAAEFCLTVRRYDPTTCMVYHTKATLGPRVPSFTVHVQDTVDGGIRVYGEGGKV